MNRVELLVDAVIGSEDFNARDVIRNLRSENPDEVHMIINSVGGSVFEALAIYDYLKGSGARVTSHIEGIAASAASFLMFAGEKPTMSKNSVVMIHNSNVPVVSMERMNSDEIREYIKGLQSEVDFMDKINDRMAGIYSEVTGIGVEEIKSMMDAETWIYSEEALEKGFVSGITEGMAVAASASKEDLEVFGYTNIPEDYVNQLNNVDMSENTEKSLMDKLKALIGGEVEAPKAEAKEQVEAKEVVDVEALKAEISASLSADMEAKLEASKKEVEELKAAHEAEINAKAEELEAAKKELDKAKASRAEVESKEDVSETPKKEEVKDVLGEYVLAQLKARM